MRTTNLENAIWKQLTFGYDYSIFNEKTWRDFVFYVKESSGTFSKISKSTQIKQEEIPWYTILHR